MTDTLRQKAEAATLAENIFWAEPDEEHLLVLKAARDALGREGKAILALLDRIKELEAGCAVMGRIKWYAETNIGLIEDVTRADIWINGNSCFSVDFKTIRALTALTEHQPAASLLEGK
jgi:hypothetical protein